MAITLNNLKTTKITKKRIGRGNGSGHGTYSGRGQKGQKARSGGRGGLKMKGFRRILLSMPKFKGMKNRFAKEQVILLSAIDKNFSNNETVSPAILFEKGLIGKKEVPVKILTNDKNYQINKKLIVDKCLVSASVKKAIESAGGTIA